MIQKGVLSKKLRQERIQRIRDMQSNTYWATSRGGSIVTAEHMAYFLLTCFCCGVFMAIGSIILRYLPSFLSKPLSAVVLYSAVASTDRIWPMVRTMYRAVTILLSFVVITVMLGFLIYAAVNPEMPLGKQAGERVSRWFEQKHKSINERVRQANRVKIKGSTEGENWKILVTADGYYETKTFLQADEWCQNSGGQWHIPSGEELRNLRPAPMLPRPMYFWKQGGSAVEFGRSLDGPMGLVLGGPDDKNHVICVRRDSAAGGTHGTDKQ